MTATLAPPDRTAALAGLLRGNKTPWSSLGVSAEHVVEILREEDLVGLVQRALEHAPDWPAAVKERLTREARGLVATELLRRQETARVVEALAAHDIVPVLLKGTPLAYTVYQEPSLRPRSDTDLLIRREDTDTARRAMAELGHTATNFSDGEVLFRQFELRRTDAYGVLHAFDFHWRLSTEALFADLLSYDELLREAIPVPQLGDDARAASPVHALLLACVHPAMHHRNAERLIWVYDVHLLAGMVDARGLERLASLALERGVAAICARELTRAHQRFGTVIPESILTRLGGARREPTAAYLEPDRSWRHELASNVGALGSWSERLRLLREVAFPSPAYMLRSYGISRGAPGFAALPALYAHRAARGLWRVMTGRK